MKKLLLTLLFVMSAAVSHAADQFTLPPLPYEYGALAPFIDEQTMTIHHTKHHQAYIDKLNAAFASNRKLQNRTLEDIFAKIHKYDDVVRNNAGGHWNHSFFWTVMAPQGQGGEPSPELLKAIAAKFGSMDKFKAEFEKAGVGQFGSGWVWLVVGQTGKLHISTTANQDNPLMSDQKNRGMPILGNDVWEHAYYLTYQNKRADYLKAWWDVVNWTKVSANYADALKRVKE
jgi:Fe-Mn family superoxide dismutase